LASALRVSAENFSGGGRWQKEQQDRVIAPISLPLFYQWRVRWCTGHAPRAHFKGTLHQESHVISEYLLWRNTHFRKNTYLFEKFIPMSCEKTLYPGPHLTLITPRLLTSISTSKNYDGWWELDCFYNASACWKAH